MTYLDGDSELELNSGAAMFQPTSVVTNNQGTYQGSMVHIEKKITFNKNWLKEVKIVIFFLKN